MNQRTAGSDQRGSMGPASGVEVLRQSAEFRGPIEPLDDHDHSNDHFAVIYEDEAERLAVSVPFMKHGLDQGERCLFVVDEYSRSDVTQALRRGGVDRLRQSNDRLKQFAYAASHDLQEPLRMVSSYLQLLEDRYETDLDEQAQEYIDFAADGAARMRAMVDDLLSFSRVEQTEGEFDPVDCETVLERVTNDLRIKIEENDAKIVVESLPTVMADSEQLEQLFNNLVSNAIKYSGEEPPRIEITAERRGDHWEFSVADDGIGIDPDKRDRIFVVFKRLHHDDEYPGTRIGLSLCQEIVENHGGEIWVESEPGEGSTFSFTLPQRASD